MQNFVLSLTIMDSTNKEKELDQREKLLLLMLSEQDISILVKIGH
jgi:hypothetical protein